MDKADVIAALLTLLRDELASIERMTKLARDEATSAESRPENKYDTRATEASYLAAGQGQRLIALQRLVAFLETQDGGPAPGLLDLYELEGDAGDAWFLLAPDGGGRRVRVGGRDVLVVTPESPAGAALAAARAGDAVAIGRPGAQQEYEVVAVR